LSAIINDIIAVQETHALSEKIYHEKELCRAKETFKSSCWRKDYTPNLSINPRTSVNDNTLCIIENFPRGQHRSKALLELFVS
jgi:hypothetical protein